MKKKYTYVIVLILALFLILGLSKVFSFKYEDGIQNLRTFYNQEEDSIDVLVLGSSHAYVNIDPSILYAEEGISSFALGSSSQTLWNTYIYLQEALKTQKPEVIVLEGYSLIQENEYSLREADIYKATYGLKDLKLKKEAIEISAPKEEWLKYWIPSLQTHSRFRDLEEADFEKSSKEQSHWKGFIGVTDIREREIPEVEEWVERALLYEKVELYYGKILELAKAEGIPIVVAIAPYNLSKAEMEKFNEAESIAKEYEVPFVNFNLYYDEMSLDFSRDLTNDQHLNLKGVEKFTGILGEYLKEHYELEDRRGDSRYASWEEEAKYQERVRENAKLKDCSSLEEYLVRLSQCDYKIIISTAGNYLYREYVDEVEGIGLNSLSYMAGGVFILQNKEILYYSGTEENTFYHTQLGGHDLVLESTISISHDEDERKVYKMLIDLEEYRLVNDGLNIVVWDDTTQMVIDAVGFYAHNHWEIQRK